ncbi:MAG: guanylate kinase [Pseudomonadales bacterium]|nr:guanylate kinase [Pseudomonadales bacterium]
MNNLSESGRLILVSAPSGAGKTSLVAALLEQMDNLCLSISHTTRAKRPNEQDGKNYHFISLANFDEMQRNGEFLESANVFGNRYATSRSVVTTELAKGIDVILEIDWQGAQQIRQNFSNSISIFILPPSRDALQERLKSRGQDKPEIIRQRMSDAIEQMSHHVDFDYLIVNDDFDIALQDMSTIIRAARLQLPQHNSGYRKLIKNLLVHGLESG